MKILVIDLTTRTWVKRPLVDPLEGGRLLTARLAHEFIDPRTDPLGSGNALILAAGPLAGLGVSTSGRLSIGGKSPLTRGIKESNAGGMAGDALAHLGYRAIVLTGQLSDLGLLMLDSEGVHFAGANTFAGLGNEATADRIRTDYGDDHVLISIGPAGEQQCGAAAIAVTDVRGQPFRMAARGGLGAVMGSKRLKAILLRRPAAQPIWPLSPDGRAAAVAFNKFVATSPRITVLREYGTASTIATVQAMAGMVVNNFSRGQHPDPDAIGGERLHDTILARGGEGTPTEACMRGCVIQCSNIYPDAAGRLAVAPLEFETLGLCGSNLGLSSLDEIARINRLCNDLGLDTIEVGAALGVMMEAAERGVVPEPYAGERLPRFGDGVLAAEIVAQVAHATLLGKLVAAGVVAAGAALGVEHVPAVKGQAMSAYDPRVVKGTGVTYATSPQGADHTAGLTVFFPGDHLDPQRAVVLSRSAQIQRAAYDALGLCAFNTGATGQRPDLVTGAVAAAYGITLPDDWMDTLGRRVIERERAFNAAAGFTPEDDRLPGYFTREPLPPLDSVFDVTDQALDHIWDG